MRVVLQVGEVVARAYDTLTKLVKGENFMRKIGIQHLVRWLDGKSYGSGAAHNKHDTPNPYTMTTLPLKSPLQRKQWPGGPAFGVNNKLKPFGTSGACL